MTKQSNPQYVMSTLSLNITLKYPLKQALHSVADPLMLDTYRDSRSTPNTSFTYPKKRGQIFCDQFDISRVQIKEWRARISERHFEGRSFDVAPLFLAHLYLRLRPTCIACLWYWRGGQGMALPHHGNFFSPPPAECSNIHVPSRHANFIHIVSSMTF